MQLPVTLPLHPSRCLALLLIAAHGGALFCVAGLAMALAWQALLAALILLSLAWCLHEAGARQRIHFLTLHADGTLACTSADGVTRSRQVHPQSTVTPWLVVLRLRGAGWRSEALALLPDAMAVEDFRRLRLWLRWRAALK